jgi:hypothetical protein
MGTREAGGTDEESGFKFWSWPMMNKSFIIEFKKK